MAASRNKKPADDSGGERLLSALSSRLSCADFSDACFGIALSGGRDSIVLLDVLARLLPPSRLRVLHVHHGRSVHSDEWAAFCEAEAQARGLSATVYRVSVTPDGEGWEAAARRARYAALAQAGCDVLVLAHHQDDQAETVLFRLCRGAGVAGLAGMSSEGFWGAQRLWRPLLDEPRGALGAYAVNRGLRWIEDDSNADARFTRNFLRSEVLPLLETRFPGVSDRLARAAKHASEALSLLSAQARLAGADSDALNLRDYQSLPSDEQRNVLRYWLQAVGWPMPEARTLADWQSRLQVADQQTSLLLPYPAGQILLWRGALMRVPHRSPPEQPQPWSWASLATGVAWGVGHLCSSVSGGDEGEEAVFSLSCRVSLMALKAAEAAGVPLTWRVRQGGERLQVAQNRPERSLQRHLQEADCPSILRRQIPLLWSGETLVACPGVGVAYGWVPVGPEDALRVSWKLGESAWSR